MRCECGREHVDYIKIHTGAGILGKLTETISGYGDIVVVSDINTKRFADMAAEFIPSFREFIFQSDELIPDEAAVEELTEAVKSADLIVAVGSGTINDLCRHVSFGLHIPYVIVATAASMDGYASSVSPLMVGGLKTTVPGQIPLAIISDLALLETAPKRMTAAGFGDLLGKFTCLLDWKMGSLFFGEYYCGYIASVTEESVRAACRDMDVLNIQRSLIQSGVAMSYAGNSRPASGAEHHISHFLEMKFLSEGRKAELHGIKVGMATLAVIKLYEYLLAETPDWRKISSGLDEFDLETYCADIIRVFGTAGLEIIKEAEWYDKANRLERLALYEKNWGSCTALCREFLPEYSRAEGLLKKAGCPVSPVELGIGREMFQDAPVYAKEIRSRFTLLRLLDDLGLLETYAERLVGYYYK